MPRPIDQHLAACAHTRRMQAAWRAMVALRRQGHQLRSAPRAGMPYHGPLDSLDHWARTWEDAYGPQGPGEA